MSLHGFHYFALSLSNRLTILSLLTNDCLFVGSSFCDVAIDWRQKEVARISETLTGAERQVALAQVVDEEAQLISCIARRRFAVVEDNKKMAIEAFLKKVRLPQSSTTR